MSEEQDQPTVIEVLSGVSLFTHEPFCTVIVDGKPSGQMSPNEIRTMALGWLESAEAAESDAMILAEMIDPDGMDMPIEAAGAFISALRQRRSYT